MALARMIQIGSARSGRDGFSKKLLADAEEVLGRAGERMRLSSSHTVVVLAGGTGSGKSSLFNRLAGADFSTVGVTRPVTRDAHACIWGEAGSGALIDWLGVSARNRYSRASALDRGEDDLAGLVLLDLPDHDSVMSHSGDLVDRLVSHGRRDHLGARPAEVRGRGRAPPVPGSDGRPLRRAGHRAEPGGSAGRRARPTTASPICGGCSTPRTCPTCRSWSPRRITGAGLDGLRKLLVEGGGRQAGRRGEDLG